MLMKEFVKRHGITMTTESWHENPNFDGSEQMHHYRCELTKDGSRMKLFYSMGLGLKGRPTVEDVLECLALDAVSYDNTADFEDWANELGYSDDSIKACRTYKAVKRQTEALKKFLGEAYYTLRWEIEEDE